MMSGNYKNTVFIWLLMMTSIALNTGLEAGFTDSTTMDITNQNSNQATTPEVSSADPETFPLNPTEKPIASQKPSTTTEEMSTISKSSAKTGTVLGSYSTKPTMATQMTSHSTQSQGTEKTSTLGFKTSGGSTPSILATEIGSTATISTKPGENTPDTTSQVTDRTGSAAQTTTPYRTSVATAIIHSTEAKKRPGRPGDQKNPKAGTFHGKAVAGLIGGALVLMMVGFLVIYVKKRKLRKQTITATDWAGPSPFLDGGSNGQNSRQSSNRISLSSFLPQRMSRRLSLLPETEEELQDMTPATFGNKAQKNSFDQKVDENGVQESNGSAAVDPEPKHTPESTEISENSAPSSQTQNTASTNDNNPDVTNTSEAEEKFPLQMESDPGAP